MAVNLADWEESTIGNENADRRDAYIRPLMIRSIPPQSFRQDQTVHSEKSKNSHQLFCISLQYGLFSEPLVMCYIILEVKHWL